jgi:flagellar biogenesis protein FliO
VSQGLFESYAAEIARALIALAAVCLLAVFVFRGMAKRGFGMRSHSGAVRVIQRVALEPRRALYLVRVGSRVLLIGISESGGPQLLAELDPATVPEELSLSQPSESLGDRLRRLIRSRGGRVYEPNRSRESSDR